MSKLIASWRTTSLGYDAANTRLLDESGNGNHLPLLGGTPDFTGSYGGVSGVWNMVGTAYFGRENLLQASCHTAILTLHPNLNAADTIRALWATGRFYPQNGDPGHQSPALPFEDGTFSGAQLDAPFVQIEPTNCQFGNAYSNVRPGSGFTANAWNVLTYVWSGDTSQVKGRFGTGVWGTAAIAQHYQGLLLEEMRLGYKPFNLTTTGNVNGTTTISGLASTTGVAVGQTVYAYDPNYSGGANANYGKSLQAAGTTVASIVNSNTITVSNAASASSSGVTVVVSGPASIITSDGSHLGAARVEIYEGDYSLDDPAGYAGRIAALIASPGL